VSNSATSHLRATTDADAGDGEPLHNGDVTLGRRQRPASLRRNRAAGDSATGDISGAREATQREITDVSDEGEGL